MDAEVVCHDKCSNNYIYHIQLLANKKTLRNQNSIKLRIDGSLLKHDINPTYLGITFDQRMTWKPQIDKVEKSVLL